MSFHAELRSALDSKLAELTTSRQSLLRATSEYPDADEIVPEITILKDLRISLREAWQGACEAYSASHDGEQMDEELIGGYADGVVREFILDIAYEEPAPQSSSEEVSTFYENMFDSLDIGLVLFEVAYEQYQTTTSLDAGASLSLVLEDLGDVLSIQGWSVVFGWIERRAEEITLGMQPSKGKSLTLLKLFNHLLQQTSHVMVDFGSSTDTLLLRARLHLFITEWFKLNDMSGVNLRGEYSEMRQNWPGLNGEDDDEDEGDEQTTITGATEEPVKTNPDTKDETIIEQEEVEGGSADGAEAQDDQPAKPQDAESDKQEMKESDPDNADPEPAADQPKSEAVTERMEVDEPEPSSKAQDEPSEPQPEDLYTAMYHLQMIFANPPLLVGSRPAAGTSTSNSLGETPMQAFRRRTDIVLKEMSSRRGEAIEMAKSMREAALAGVDSTGLYTNAYPAYLVSRRTLQSDLINPIYRKRIYAQFIILLNQLSQLTEKERPKHPKTAQFPPSFFVSPSDAEWAAEITSQIKSELMKLQDGRDFEARIRKMIDMDRHYALWKQLSCPPLEQKSAEDSTIAQAESNRKRIIAPLRPYRWTAGTKSLSRLGADPLTGVEQLKGFKVAETVLNLKEKYDREVAEEEDEKAMGRDDPTRLGPFVENMASLSWKALRLASRTDLNAFSKARNGDLPDLVSAIEAKRAEVAGTETTAPDNEETNNMENMGAEGDTPVPEETVERTDEDAPPEQENAPVDDVKEEPEIDSMVIESEDTTVKPEPAADVTVEHVGDKPEPTLDDDDAMEVETKPEEAKEDTTETDAQQPAVE